MKYGLRKLNVIKNTYRITKTDIMQGIWKRWYLFILILPIVFYQNIQLISSLELQNRLGNIDSVLPSTMDYIIYFFEGMLEYIPNENPFEIPIMFLSVNMIPILIIAYYPVNDFQERSKIIFTRTGNRSSWWYSKCIWNLMSIFIFYIILYLGIFIFSALRGTTSFMPTAEILKLKYGVIGELSLTMLFLYEIILPILTTMALSLLQMTLSIIFSPIYGVVMQVLILIISAFYISPLLPGNYLMFMRNFLYREDGIRFIFSVMICLCISIFSIICGKVFVDRKDIL